MNLKLSSPFLERKPRLELVSLLDVMFLVLVFFIYAIFDMAVHHGLKIELPSATGVHERGERIVVTLDAHDALQLNGRPLERTDLVMTVKRLVAAKPELPVLIAGDRKASLGAGVELLAELKSSGVEKASFQVSGSQAVKPRDCGAPGADLGEVEK